MRDKKFLLPIIFTLGIILSLGWYQFIHEPARRDILGIELETRRLRQIEREILNLKSSYENLSAFVEEKNLQLDEARIFLPSTLEQDKFIDELYRTADFLDVRIISIRTGEIIQSEYLQSQTLIVNLEANYVSLLNFIREILDGDRLTSLERFSMERTTGTILSCDLAFRIFAAAP